VLFKCGRCHRLITISDPSLLTVYEGHFYCMTCRIAGGYRCASQQEESALHFEEMLPSSVNTHPCDALTL
jgi:hypothetical protein